MFNFDNFVNKPCIEIFGRDVTYIPSNTEFSAFSIKGDFHKNYQEVKTDSSGVEISSNEIVIFLRDAEMPSSYKEANQGDYIEIENCCYQIIDIQHHIPGSKKLILHESSASSN